MWVDFPQLRKPLWRLFCGQQRYGQQLDWRIVEQNSGCDCMSTCWRCPLMESWARLHKCSVSRFALTIKGLKHTPNNKVMVRSIFTRSSLLSSLSSCLSLVTHKPPQYSSSWSVPVPLASLHERRVACVTAAFPRRKNPEKIRFFLRGEAAVTQAREEFTGPHCCF